MDGRVGAGTAIVLAIGAALSFALASACSSSPTFNCSDDGQCDAGGQCEATGYCSFEDSDCDSGRRYGEYAGGYTGMCVGPGDSDTDPSSSAGGSTTTTATTGSTDDGATSSSTTPVDDTTDATSASTTTGNPSTTDDDDSTTDGSSGSTGGPVVDPSCFVDEFDDEIVGAYFAPFTPPDGTSVTETGGELVFGLNPDPAYVVLESSEENDRTDTLVRVEVAATPNQTTSAQLMVGLANGAERLLVQISQGVLQARIQTTLSEFTLHGTKVFDANTHRWVQVREQDGVTYFETSPDLQTWTQIYDVATPFDLSAATTLFIAGTWETVTDPGEPALETLHDCPSP